MQEFHHITPQGVIMPSQRLKGDNLRPKRWASACRFGGCTSAAARAFLAAMALPFDETAPNGSKASLPPVREKNRGGRPRNNAASIIYASVLQQSLAVKGNAAA